MKTRTLSAQKWLIFAALVTVALCGVGFWFLWGSPPADAAPAAQPVTGALEPVTQPALTGGRTADPTTDPNNPADPFSAAAVRQRPAAPGSASGSTDCVALMAVFEGALPRCTAARDRQNCALAAVKNQGFDPATYDMCKLFRPAP